jgi:hypothetical protein
VVEYPVEMNPPPRRSSSGTLLSLAPHPAIPDRFVCDSR